MPFWKFPTEIAPLRELSSTAKVVYTYIRDRQGSNAHAWPGFRRIAADCGVSTDAAQRAIVQLVEIRLIETIRTGGKKGTRTNRYRVVDVEAWAAERTGNQHAERTGIQHKQEVPSVLETSTLCTGIQHASVPESSTKPDSVNQTQEPDPSSPQASCGVVIPPPVWNPQTGRMEAPPAPEVDLTAMGEAIVAAFRLKSLSRIDRARVHNVAAQLETKGATPGDVPERLAAFRLKWPHLHPKPDSLLANWERLDDPPLRLATG